LKLTNWRAMTHNSLNRRLSQLSSTGTHHARSREQEPKRDLPKTYQHIIGYRYLGCYWYTVPSLRTLWLKSARRAYIVGLQTKALTGSLPSPQN
jgi:hypothetical protein